MSRGRRASPTRQAPDPKTCRICGRTIEWRRKWARDWDQVRYCSDACRQRRREDTSRLEVAILRLLDHRAGGATICPSEVARAEFAPDEWRDRMEEVRQAARRLVAAGRLEITQKGQIVDPSTAKGPIRLRLP